MRSHHDNREKLWNVSLTEQEYEEIEALWKASGLSKAAFARRALAGINIVPKLTQDDKDQLKELNRMHASVNQIAKIVNSIKKENLQSEDVSLVRYLMKVKDQINEIDDNCAEIVNYFSSRVSR